MPTNISNSFQFGLNAGGEAGKKDRQYAGEGQFALAAESLGIEANRIEQLWRVEAGNEGAQNFQEFKIPFSLTS